MALQLGVLPLQPLSAAARFGELTELGISSRAELRDVDVTGWGRSPPGP